MILIAKRIVTAILNTLGSFHRSPLRQIDDSCRRTFRLLFLENQSRQSVCVCLFKLIKRFSYSCFYDLLRFAACFNGLQIIRREVLLKVASASAMSLEISSYAMLQPPLPYREEPSARQFVQRSSAVIDLSRFADSMLLIARTTWSVPSRRSQSSVE